ncbi:MAG: VWA domain-containing protein [Myxococcota bacterium]|nr:VWA domain-containing protein [Myxococcota bacterium]MDW8363366.1 VWA domain-containing protein [Myxococcales bacterium]
MQLLGLTLAQWLGLLAAAAAAVFALHLLRVHRRRVEVPFLALWQQAVGTSRPSRLWARLRWLLSLVLGVLIVACLTLAIADPRLVTATAGGRTLVVLLDASASMLATDEPGGRFEAARRHVRRLVESLGPADRALLVRMHAVAEPLGPLASDRTVLLQALDAARPTHAPARPEPALRLALDALRGQPRPGIVLVSDGAFEPPAPATLEELQSSGTPLAMVSVGREDRNVAVTALAARRHPLDRTRCALLVELWNAGTRRERVELRLLGDGRPLDVEHLELEPGERIRRVRDDVTGADRLVEAHIVLADGPDALPLDDRAVARIPERRRMRVLTVGEGNLYLEAALLLDEYLDVTHVRPAEYRDAHGYDAAIFDGFVPPAPPGVDAIFLHPTGGSGWQPIAVEGRIERPSFERVDRDHPLVRWVALRDVNVAEALRLRPEPRDRIVASDPRGPLLVEGERDGRRIVVLAFDVRHSDLVLRAAWPLLLLNALERFAETSVELLASPRAGEVWTLPVGATARRVRMVEPDGRLHPLAVRDGRIVFRAEQAGAHVLEVDGRRELIASQLPPGEESRIAPVRAPRWGSLHWSRALEGRPQVDRTPWAWLAAVALVLLVVEWLAYHRRWTA